MANAKRVLARMLNEVLSDGLATEETVTVTQFGVSVQSSEGLIRYFVDSNEVSCCDAYDYLDDRLN